MGMIATPSTTSASQTGTIVNDPFAGIGATPSDPSGGILQGGELDFSGIGEDFMEGMADTNWADVTSNVEAQNLGITTEELQEQKLATQTQARDVQLNPLPSIPSISNIGSVPFTGTVHTIPGGFQPLPQVAGGRKKLYQLSQFHGGLNKKSSPRDISDIECQEAANVAFSSIGRIKLLGDIANTDNSITVTAADDLTSADMGSAGYGLFQFTAPADHDGGNIGSYVLTLTADGNGVDIYSAGAVTDGAQGNWMTIGGTDNHGVAQVYYSAGNGVYAADAYFGNDNANSAKIYVSRSDINGTVDVSGWKEGNPLITSPTFHATNAASTVSIETAAVAASNNGEMAVQIEDTGTGTWKGTYFFYVSYLFDGGCETGLTSMGTDAGFDDDTLEFNVSIQHTNAAPLGGDKRIEGARIYFKKSGDAERWLLAEISLIDGVRGALDSTFTPWDTAAAPVYDLASDIIFDAPPEVYSYSSLNSYYANEVYAKSPDAASNGAGPAPLGVRYKTAVVGSGGIVFIGNVRFDSKHMPDSMMYSMPGKPAVFPKYNRFDSPSSDGSPITALAVYRDTILQFKQNGMYVINVSNPNQFYAQASFRDCGVFNPCQVFTTSFGVIFANKHGCYIYDGQKVTSLTHGKFNVGDWGLSEGTSADFDASSVPSIGYDPRSQSIIVLKNIGDDATDDDEDAWVYSMVTQSWTEGKGIVDNDNDERLSNFIITSGGYLTLKQDTVETLYNYNHVQPDRDQTIDYRTKDLDFGLPSQTKKIFKVYVTYVSNDSQVPTLTYGKDGDTTPNESFDSGSFGNTSGVPTTTTFTVSDTDLTGIKSLTLKISGAIDHEFEIQDISILYRARPIK